MTPTDVSGARLGLALNAPTPRPLAVRRLEHPDGGGLLLGVLGASHVVTIERDGRRTFSEQISCACGDGLPAESEARGYHLESRTEEYDEPSFRTLARELRDWCAHGTGWLGGVFPGDDAALTALAAEPDGPGWRWQTWHLYPSGPGGTVVHTASRWHP